LASSTGGIPGRTPIPSAPARPADQMTNAVIKDTKIVVRLTTLNPSRCPRAEKLSRWLTWGRRVFDPDREKLEVSLQA
jgi:hypothetical protein